MKQPIIVLADPDGEYLTPIEHRLNEQLHGQAEIVVITDREYLEKYFSVPRKLNTLFINRKYFSGGLEKHDINCICIVTEDADECEKGNNDFVRKIFRFASLGALVTAIIDGIGEDSIEELMSKSAKTTMIAVASPVGGSGKTTVAVGLCAALAKQKKKVLFVDTNSIQSSTFWIEPKRSQKGDRDSKTLDAFLASETKDLIQKNLFDYVAQFQQALPALGLCAGSYIPLLEQLRKADKYDYIVVDMSADMNEDNSKLMLMADNVILVLLQDDFSAHKLQRFLNNIDCSDSEKFTLVCNKFRAERTDSLLSLVKSGVVTVAEYVPYVLIGNGEGVLEAFADFRSFKRIASRYT